MRIVLTVPPKHINAGTLGAGLAAATKVNEEEIASGKIPPVRVAIADHGVRWRPEPPGDESFDRPSQVLARKWGDCDDLAPWRAAELRVTGVDPYAKAIAVPSGPRKWHAIVQRGNGDIEDPSAWAGMPTRSGQGAPVRVPLHTGRASIYVSGPMDRVQGVRVDVPGVRAQTAKCPVGYAVMVRDADKKRALHEALAEATHVARVSGIADPKALAILRSLYRWFCQDTDIHKALGIEGVRYDDVAGVVESVPLLLRGERSTKTYSYPRASSASRDEVGIIPCLGVIGGIIAGVGAAVGGVSSVVKAVMDGINATVKQVTEGLKPIEDLYKQTKAAIDQGTIQLQHVQKTVNELRAQGFHMEADKLTAEAQAASDAKGRREFLATGDEKIATVEDLMRGWRFTLTEATEVAPFNAQNASDARQRVKADIFAPFRAKQFSDVSRTPQEVWNQLAMAFGLDPETASPLGRRVVRGVSQTDTHVTFESAEDVWNHLPAAHRTPQMLAQLKATWTAPKKVPRGGGAAQDPQAPKTERPQPASSASDDDEFLTPGLDALFRRGGAFM